MSDSPDAVVGEMNAESESKCPVVHSTGGTSNRDWWPNQLNVNVLHRNSPKADPLGAEFDYATQFASLDLAAVKQDIDAVMTTSQDWWPADYGHYGRCSSGWPGTARARTASATAAAAPAPASSASPRSTAGRTTRTSTSTQAARPVKQKYGQKLSWADLIFSPATAPWSRWGSPLRLRRRPRRRMGARGGQLGSRGRVAR